MYLNKIKIIMKFIYVFIILICIQCKMISQIHQCPIDGAYIISGYKNDEIQQKYRYFRKSSDAMSITFTVLSDSEEKSVKSIINGKVFAITDNLDCVVIVVDSNRFIIYDLIKDITVKKGDTVEVGTILGKPMLNTFPPRKYQDLLGVKTELYNVNMAFYYFDKEKQTLVHEPVPLESMGCNIIVCDNCQPRIYGM